ncbi:MAG: penicillin-binding transpeptidase domain-containing protein [Patescibacteria group bacterium]
MFSFPRILKKMFRGTSRSGEIDPHEILLDSRNLPEFDVHQFEGRIERPISRIAIWSVGIFFIIAVGIFSYRTWDLQISNGATYVEKGEKNRLRHSLIFASRGVIYDRNNTLLAWNSVNPNNPDVANREYLDVAGIGNLVGYVKYPTKDKTGFYFREDFVGLDGVEKAFNDSLVGKNGLKLTETAALGTITAENQAKPATEGLPLTLAIDVRLQSALFSFIQSTAHEVGFSGGAGVLMDVYSGELLAITTYPEYNSKILTDGIDNKKITAYTKDKNQPFLNRAIDGLYTPGSIVKPFVALGALSESIIRPEKEIISTGSISIQSPYNPDVTSVFTDWKAHGAVDMRKALAVSSNVYFYEVGGGFEGQRGLGITKLEKYFRLFGFGEPIAGDMFTGTSGIIPNPDWKKKNFDGEEWRLGDTYYTAIGQYGFQATPLQAVRAVATIANDGVLLTPVITRLGQEEATIADTVPIATEHIRIVKEGMRDGVLIGTAKGLNNPQVTIAAKTGTAELGVSKEKVNSWVIGFFPYENPRYAFAVTMEKGSRNNVIGALYVVRQFIEWMAVNTPEYLEK